VRVGVPVLADRLAVRLAAAGERQELGLLALFGTSQFGMGLLLLALGTPLVSATRGALLGVLQTPLATLWVWLAFAEQPAIADPGRRCDRDDGSCRRHAGTSRDVDHFERVDSVGLAGIDQAEVMSLLGARHSSGALCAMHRHEERHGSAALPA
jgi:hypothetical protein